MSKLWMGRARLRPGSRRVSRRGFSSDRRTSGRGHNLIPQGAFRDEGLQRGDIAVVRPVSLERR